MRCYIGVFIYCRAFKFSSYADSLERDHSVADLRSVVALSAVIPSAAPSAATPRPPHACNTDVLLCLSLSARTLLVNACEEGKSEMTEAFLMSKLYFNDKEVAAKEFLSVCLFICIF
ncbi:hypothetical protein SEVIR_2G162800v4 [Setaria viridis]|uniref:Uncharacterized protein n=2 Tax=Setaria TaxID=4554 RepID=A0A368Q156_SETIT|nr:hypothetical protein SETIT_2G149100v2 [Setaria italica]TKW32219.1 hypothetical protein SEVIR_2G162800v2 [Setaria viridis]